jgi:signal transduction histidine kinase
VKKTEAPFRRELRILIASLIVFLAALIVTLLALAVSILQVDRLTSTADTASAGIANMAAVAAKSDLEKRLELLRVDHGIARVEVYRGEELYAASGALVPAAEVLTRRMPGGRIVFYFDASAWIGGRRTALIVGALATMATIAGLLILILYLPKFARPVEEMLAHARQLGDRTRGDDDARYLVHTFREAVERIQQQSTELDHLRDAATSRGPDVTELARTLERSFSSGFLSLDDASRVVAINEPGRVILGLTHATPFPLEQLGDEAFASVLQASFNSRVGVTRREVLLTSTDSVIGVTTVPLFNEDAYIGMLALFTDLTTLRAMEARLRDLENLVGLGHMSAGIAHEFRNSLFTILGYLRLAQRNAPPETESKIRSAEEEATKLGKAVDALLNFARPLTLRSQRLDLGVLAESVVERFTHEYPDVQFVPRFETAEISGDRELLERALENIVRNAVDAVRQQHPDGGGRVEVAVIREPNATVTVRDNGIGVNPEEAATFLLPFQSGKPHGFGLGLPLARKIVLHHGGSLALTGSPGAGAEVRMEFFG